MEYYGNDWCRTDSGWGICSSSCYENVEPGKLELLFNFLFKWSIPKFVKQQVENPAIFHFPTLATPTMSAWNIMAMIGAEQILVGVFAPTPAINT